MESIKKKNQLGPGLMIGIPTLGRPVSLDWALSLKALNPPINFNSIFSIVKNQQVADARNAIAEKAVESGCKYLFFMGDDTVSPPHSLRQLIYRMEQNNTIGVVGGVYCSKTDPPAPLVFKEDGQGSYWDWKIGEFFQCSGLGMDCTLIRTEVFKEISKPWFKTVDSDGFMDGKNQAEMWTEDLYFLKKLHEETSWKVFCDASVICDHVDVYSGKVYKLPKDSLPLRQKLTNGSFKKVLILGPSLELNEPCDITRVNNNEDPDADYRCEFDNLPFAENQFDWVIITEPHNRVTVEDEWFRVAKFRISINFNPWIDITYVAHQLNGTVDGTFVDIYKPKEANVISN